MMNRRDFLKISALTIGGVLVPPPQIEWPPSVVTKFDINKEFVYALTVDDGYDAEVILPIVRFCYDNGMRGTWFATGTGLRAIRDLPEIGSRMISGRWSVGYHTMKHPSIEEQKKYDRQRWIDDYDQWRELALENFPEYPYGPSVFGAYRSIAQPYARAAGGFFSDPFLEMCEERDLTPYGWSKDPTWIGDHPTSPIVERGDIWLLHFRNSDWPWFEKLSAAAALFTPETIENVVWYQRNERLGICSPEGKPPCYHRKIIGNNGGGEQL